MLLKTSLTLLLACWTAIILPTSFARSNNPYPARQPFRKRANIDPNERVDKHGFHAPNQNNQNPPFAPLFADEEPFPSTGPSYDETPAQQRHQRKKRENTIVDEYTRSFVGQLGVSISAAGSMALITHFFQLMIFSQSWSSVIAASSIAGALSIYLQGNFSEFSKSLGVFAILVLRGMSIHRFLPKFVRQLQSCLMLAQRRPFPPGPNPWKYSQDETYFDPSVAKFSMTNVLICLLLSGGIFGWMLTKPIPLFPTWLGAIGGACLLGYGGTLLDGVGDFLRFLGHTLLGIFSFLFRIADDVQLRANTQVMIGNLLFFLRGVDKQYHIMQRLQVILAVIVSKITKIIYSIKREQLQSSEPIVPPHRSRYSDRGPRNAAMHSLQEDDDYYNEEMDSNEKY